MEQTETILHDEECKSDIYGIPALILTVERYEGDTCEGQFQGPGVAYFEGGHVYEGMFARGFMDGHGVFTCADGLKYEGEFVCNMPKGRGTYTWLDGSSYEGEVHNGIRHGTGTYKCAKTSVSYTGQWDQGKRHGQGVLYYKQDKTSWYNGDWVKNSREGWGMRRYPSGNIYCGEWKSNLRHGEGTMRWLNLDQHYVGMWEKGLQHGRGTHIWILRQATGSQSLMSNQYKGDFVQGQRHGQGTIYYACGATYEGEWSNNKSHGKGKFTSTDGRVFEGASDQMMTLSLTGNRPLIPLCDMALNIDWLLDMVPQKVREPEREQVEFEMLIHSTQLRSVYKFYSRLGRAHSPHGAFLLTRLQLWRLLKDCNVHHHDITLIQIDRFVREEAEIHSPFTPILLRRLLSCLVAVAYHLYHRDMGPQKNLLAACFSKLMTDNILPNATNVKGNHQFAGFLCRQPDCTEAALNYLQKCWEIYQTYCRVNRAPKDDRTMTCRDLLWMFQGLHLLDNNLTIVKLMQIITAESRDPRNLTSCLDSEITFLEFFEVLLGSAEVKCPQVPDALEVGLSLSSPDARKQIALAEMEASEKLLQPTDTSQPTEKSSDESELSAQESQEQVSAGQTETHRQDGEDIQSRGTKFEGHEINLWIQTIHQFFNMVFFPAFEKSQLKF